MDSAHDTMRLCPLLLLLALSGCEEQLEYEGHLGVPLRMELLQDIPTAYLSFDGAAPVRAVVDTATPLVIDAGNPGWEPLEKNLRVLEILECRSDWPCKDPRLQCDLSAGVCVPRRCKKRSDCGDARLGCDSVKETCSQIANECQQDRDCLDPGLPLCQSGLCLPTIKKCTGQGSCASPLTCVDGKCVLANPRFVFFDLEVFHLEVKPAGLAASTSLGGILGAALLGHFAVRFTYGSNPTLALLDEIPDSLEELADDCSHEKLPDAPDVHCAAVIAAARLGGGLLELQVRNNDDEWTEELELSATRLVLPVCLMPAKFDRTKKTGHGAEKATGVPVAAVLATGLGTSLIARSAFERLCAAEPSFKQVSLCDEKTGKGCTTLHLPYGEEKVTIVTLDRVALVSDETYRLGTCDELALRRRLLLAGRIGLPDKDQQDLDEYAFNGASTAVLTRPVQFAVMRDEAPYIQGLRTELGTSSAAVDAVVGGSMLKDLSLEVDYPASRVILRCLDSAAAAGSCEVLPYCAHPDNSDKAEILCPASPAG